MSFLKSFKNYALVNALILWSIVLQYVFFPASVKADLAGPVTKNWEAGSHEFFVKGVGYISCKIKNRLKCNAHSFNCSNKYC